MSWTSCPPSCVAQSQTAGRFRNNWRSSLLKFVRCKCWTLHPTKLTFAYVYRMYFRNVLMIQLCSDGLCCLLVLHKSRIVGSECSDMLHYDLIRLCAESVYFKAAESKHFIMVLSVLDRHESIEELLLGREGNVSSHPVFSIAHCMNLIITVTSSSHH